MTDCQIMNLPLLLKTISKAQGVNQWSIKTNSQSGYTMQALSDDPSLTTKRCAPTFKDNSIVYGLMSFIQW